MSAPAPDGSLPCRGCGRRLYLVAAKAERALYRFLRPDGLPHDPALCLAQHDPSVTAYMDGLRVGVPPTLPTEPGAHDEAVRNLALPANALRSTHQYQQRAKSWRRRPKWPRNGVAPRAPRPSERRASA
jgi:hypothetical protein